MKIANAFSFMLLSLTCLITGCATPYYGYTEDEWEQLSAQEKRAAQSEYKDIIEYQYRRKHEDQFEIRKQEIIDRGTGL